MSDNFYFIGYRFDCKETKNQDMFEISDRLKDLGYNVDYFPGKKFFVWEHADAIHGSILCMKVKGIPADYRCPIDREELWEEMHKKSFDVPDDYDKHREALINEPIYKALIKEFGKENVALRWGIFLGLG